MPPLEARSTPCNEGRAVIGEDALEGKLVEGKAATAGIDDKRLPDPCRRTGSRSEPASGAGGADISEGTAPEEEAAGVEVATAGGEAAPRAVLVAAPPDCTPAPETIVPWGGTMPLLLLAPLVVLLLDVPSCSSTKESSLSSHCTHMKRCTIRTWKKVMGACRAEEKEWTNKKQKKHTVPPKMCSKTPTMSNARKVSGVMASTDTDFGRVLARDLPVEDVEEDEMGSPDWDKEEEIGHKTTHRKKSARPPPVMFPHIHTQAYIHIYIPLPLPLENPQTPHW